EFLFSLHRGLCDHAPQRRGSRQARLSRRHPDEDDVILSVLPAQAGIQCRPGSPLSRGPTVGQFFRDTASLYLAMMSGGVAISSSTIFCSFSPATGVISSFDFSASARKAGSFTTSASALRSRATRSAGTPGGAK